MSDTSLLDVIYNVMVKGWEELRKRLTIVVELVAKPELLLFLDEPTSGLYDLQTAWSICALLWKLANHGRPFLWVFFIHCMLY